MTPLEEQVEKAIEAAELALDAQMDVFLNHDNPFGFETFSPYKAAKIAIEAALAALTQKGEPRACTGCANGCAGCKGKGKPYGEELMRQLRQGQKGDNE